MKKKNRNYKHGFANSALYRVWVDMKRRCDKPNRVAYKDYGGRGIKVCSEWYNFINFKNWALSNGYSDKLLIDRINNDGNYEPNNCRFVNRYESELNKRKKIYNNIRFHKSRYEVSMRRYGIYYYVGTSKTLEEAIILRDNFELNLVCKGKNAAI